MNIYYSFSIHIFQHSIKIKILIINLNFKLINTNFDWEILNIF